MMGHVGRLINNNGMLRKGKSAYNRRITAIGVRHDNINGRVGIAKLNISVAAGRSRKDGRSHRISDRCIGIIREFCQGGNGIGSRIQYLIGDSRGNGC